MAETYTSGTWNVKPGDEDEFVEAWKQFVGWAAEQPGSGTFRLLHDRDHQGRFTSFGQWASVDAEQAWLNMPEFAERLGRVRYHCIEANASSFDVVATVP